MKTYGNTTASQAKDNIKDLVIWGKGDMWRLICKASSQEEEWMVTTKALEIPGYGVVLQTERQQGEQLSQSTVKLPSVFIKENKDESGKVVSRELYAEDYSASGNVLLCAEQKPLTVGEIGITSEGGKKYLLYVTDDGEMKTRIE